MRKNITSIAILLTISILVSSCDFFLGKRKDEQVDEIFRDGKIDPQIVPNNIGYVPVMPIWKNFSNPVDVFVGYDEMVYVVDDNGLNVLDQTGNRLYSIPILGASDVTQDRRLHTYVAGRVIVAVGGKDYNLPAVYHLVNTGRSASPTIIDTIIHPFDDASRRNIGVRPFDEEVQFTGLAVRADNVLYVSRKGIVNDPLSTAYPDNSILIFDINGKNTSYAKGLNPTQPNLKSSFSVSSIATFTGPPQRLSGINTSHDFVITQSRYPLTNPIEYSCLWIKEVYDPDVGIAYQENTVLLNTDTTKADRFLFTPYLFQNPTDVYIAPDQTGYIFVVDAAKDSLFLFTSAGFEGINPPVGSKTKKQVKVSFGGRGSSAYQFHEPSGVCYFSRMVFVADKKNNRIVRYRLSTDIE